MWHAPASGCTCSTEMPREESAAHISDSTAGQEGGPGERVARKAMGTGGGLHGVGGSKDSGQAGVSAGVPLPGSQVLICRWSRGRPPQADRLRLLRSASTAPWIVSPSSNLHTHTTQQHPPTHPHTHTPPRTRRRRIERPAVAVVAGVQGRRQAPTAAAAAALALLGQAQQVKLQLESHLESKASLLERPRQHPLQHCARRRHGQAGSSADWLTAAAAARHQHAQRARDQETDSQAS